MDTFYALAEPTRRKILELLAEAGELSASEICGKFPVSAPAISQHLKILREAGLVSMEKHAQQRIYRANPQALLEMTEWAGRFARLASARYDALEALLQQEKDKRR